jgi:hypothetical protein
VGFEGVARHSEAGLFVEQARQPVEDRVGVGADVESPELLIVGRVRDNRKVARRQERLQADRQPGGPCAAGQKADFQLAA